MLAANGFDNVELWPRGADTSLFNPGRRSEALRARWSGIAVDSAPLVAGENRALKTIITYVGRISDEKNIGLLISAFRGIDTCIRMLDPSHPGCKVILVGGGPAKTALEEECRDLDIEFMGYQKGEELAACYASSDIFAFPSHSETFGNVVLEALASGLPVIGLKAEGVCDLVEDGRTGASDTIP
jgi:glycosyltransferase involved in cell wall biosynthesis